MYQACILSCDDEFSQFLKITLKQKLKSVTVVDTSCPPEAIRYIVDLDSYPYPTPDGKVILLTSKVKDKPYDLKNELWLDRPFRPNRLLSILGLWEEDSSLVELPSTHSVLLGDEEISLSKKEYDLLHQLLLANGEYVSEETLQNTVFPDAEKPGVIRVYIHYLRSKIEKDHVKRIERKSGLGYRLKGGNLC